MHTCAHISVLETAPARLIRGNELTVIFAGREACYIYVSVSLLQVFSCRERYLFYIDVAAEILTVLNRKHISFLCIWQRAQTSMHEQSEEKVTFLLFNYI